MSQNFEMVYISARYETPEQRDLNERIADFLEAYGFNVHLPQNNTELLSEDGDFTSLIKPLDYSKMLITIAHEPTCTEQMRFEIKHQDSRKVPLVILLNERTKNILDPDVDSDELFAKERFVRTIVIPEDDDDLHHPLMTTMNRWFPT